MLIPQKYIARIIINSIVALLLFIGITILHSSHHIEFSLQNALTIIAIFGFIQGFSEWYYISIQEDDKKTFMVKVIILRGFKFLLYLILALAAIKLSSTNQKFYGLFIVLLFFIYTIVEFSYFFKNKK
jgi:hypothetical protein